MGTSVTITSLRLIARLSGDARLHADWAYAAARGLITRAPRFAGWLLADDWSRSRAAEIATVGDERTASTAGAYVCRDFACRRPVSTTAGLRGTRRLIHISTG